MFKDTFKDMFNFKKQRTPIEALAFYGFYTGAFLLITKVFGV